MVETSDDDDLVVIDRMAQHYLGHPYAQRDSPRVNAWIEIERRHGWGATKD